MIRHHPLWGPFPEHWGDPPPQYGPGGPADTRARREWIEQNEEADELAAGYRSLPGHGPLSARAARRVLEARRDPP